MSQPTTENTPPSAAGGGQAPAVPAPSAYVPPATQADLDKIIGDRIARERASKADYDELKAKAQQWDAAEEKNRTELEKAQKRAEEAERKAAENELRAVRSDVALAKGVPANLLAGSNRAELEQSADALLEFRGQQPAKVVSHVAPAAGGPAKGGEGGKAEAQRRFGKKDI